MSRLEPVLVALVVVSSLALVQSQHRARIQFAQLERLKSEAQRLELAHGGLMIEQSTWADPARIDRIARERLGLSTPTPVRMLTLEAGG